MKAKTKQLRLAVQIYLVRADGFCDERVQALTAAGAKYQIFKRAREAGYFGDLRSGFRDFLAKGWTARELRR